MIKAMNLNDHNRFTKTVESKVTRKLKALKHPSRSVWMGLGTMGIVGWSVAVPTLLGLFLGIWLDKHHSLGFSWTLNLLIVGVIFGCIGAWRWVSKESKSIHEDEHND
jgi:ATP synthase protein I